MQAALQSDIMLAKAVESGKTASKVLVIELLKDPATATEIARIMTLPKGKVRIAAQLKDPNIGRIFTSPMSATLAGTNPTTVFIAAEARTVLRNYQSDFSKIKKCQINDEIAALAKRVSLCTTHTHT